LEKFDRQQGSVTLPRPIEDLNNAAMQNLLFGIVDKNKQKELVAVGGLFPVDTHGKIWELGQCCVHPKYRGRRLQSALVISRTIISQVFLYNPIFVTAIKSTNYASLNNCQAAGFKPLDNMIPELLEPCKDCNCRVNLFSCCCDFYQLKLSPQDISTIANQMLKGNNNCYFPGKLDQNVDIQLSCELSNALNKWENKNEYQKIA